MKKFIFLTLICLTIITSNQVFASPSFTANLSVDVTDENVATAKTKALSKALRDALNDVILGISTPKAVEEISKLNDNQIQHFIKELQILMEKSSDVRYIADIKVEIKEDILKEYLKENNFPLSINQTKDILLIPLFQKTDNTLNLWTEENLLRQELLNKTNLKGNVVNFHLIEKNLGNITAIKTQTIYDMNEKKFKELSQFNKTDSIAVIKYSLLEKKVYVKIFPSQKTLEKEITLRDSLSSMTDDILTLIKEATVETSTSTPTQTPAQAIINVLYTYPALSSWMSLKQTLENTPEVDEINVISIANKKVHFSFVYTGPIEKLQVELLQLDYELKNNGEYYVIN